jgi:carbon-monoxide dehydrogenase small subunit
MKTTLTVNGETHSVEVTPRTQLAEILRDSLHLTGTHLGCEQGVCGACTVLVNGQPVRSCITFAGTCDGVTVETIEGFAGDELMDRLRTAFSEHHALQCGFCTPGMIVTARDIVARHADPDPALIRHELSGNLCRCTGYVGIVAAISDVIAQRNAAGGVPSNPATPLPVPGRGFPPFEAISPPPGDGGTALPASRGSVSAEGDWTVIRRRFDLRHEPQAVWARFRDLQAVAAAMPGAVLTGIDGDRFSGAVEVNFGPIRARFEGDGTHRSNDGDREGRVEGRGRDRGGQSDLRAELVYQVQDGPQAATATVDVDFRFQVQGRLAQFNRPDLVTGFADFILGQFVRNCDDLLSGKTITAGKRLSAVALILAILRSRLKSLFKSG